MDWQSIKRRVHSVGGNRLVIALSVARMGDAVGNGITMVVLPLYVAVLPSPVVPYGETVRVGLLISLYGVVATVVQPLAGTLSDRLRRHKLMIQLGLLIMAGATVAFDFASSFFHLLIFRGVQGFGVALTVPAAMGLLAAGTVQKTRGGSMGIYTSARMIGLAIGPLVGGALHDYIGFSAAFLAGAGSVALGAVIVHFAIREPTNDPPEKAAASGGDGGERPTGPSNSSSENDDDSGSLLDSRILAIAFATAVMAAAFTIMATLEKQFNERLHQTAFAFSLAFSALMLTRLMFQIPLGRLSDRIGRKPLVIAGLFLLAPSTAILGLVGTTWELVGLRLIQGAAAAAIAAPTFALAGDLARGGRESGQMGLVTAGFTLGLALGPLIAGLLAPLLFHLPFAVGGGLCLLAAWVIYHFVPETVVRSEGPSEDQHD
jgi:MFS family permease